MQSIAELTRPVGHRPVLWTAHRQYGGHSGFIGGPRALRILCPKLGEGGKQCGDLILQVLERARAMRHTCIQLIVQQRFEELCQRKFECVDVAIGVNELRGKLRERPALLHRRTAERWKHLLQCGQSQHGLDRVHDRRNLLNDLKVADTQLVSQQLELTLPGLRFLAQQKSQHERLRPTGRLKLANRIGKCGLNGLGLFDVRNIHGTDQR